MNKFYFFPQEKHSWCSNKHFTELDLNMAGLTSSSPFERLVSLNSISKINVGCGWRVGSLSGLPILGNR